jgi:hypothetical protein
MAKEKKANSPPIATQQAPAAVAEPVGQADHGEFLLSLSSARTPCGWMMPFYVQHVSCIFLVFCLITELMDAFLSYRSSYCRG